MNRFRGTWLENVPVASAVSCICVGFDLQKLEAGRGMPQKFFLGHRPAREERRQGYAYPVFLDGTN